MKCIRSCRVRHFVSTVLGVLLWMCTDVRAQEIASVPATRSSVTSISLQKAERVTDENFNRQLRSQLQSALDTAAKTLPWQAQIVAPEVLGWEVARSNAGTPLSQVHKALGAKGYEVKLDDLGKHDGSHLQFLLAKKVNEVVIGLWITGDEATFLAWAQAAPKLSLGGDVLVEGTPPLTDAMVSKYTDFLVWLFGRPQLQTARHEMTKLTAVYLADLWKGQAAPAMAGTFTILHNMQKKDVLSEGEQKGARQWLLHGLRLAAYGERGAVARDSIMTVYEMIDPTLAKGQTGAPPLTKTVRDAYVALQSFMLEQIPGGVELNTNEKAALGNWLVAAFPKWSLADQTKLAQAPLAWETLRQEWPELSAAKKIEAKKAWKAQLASLAAQVRQNRAEAKKAAEAEKEAEQVSSSKGSKGSAYERAMASARSSWRTYNTLSNAMWQSHYTRMNAMATWGGSPYRYVNQWGNPY